MAGYTAIDDPSIYFNTKLYTGNGSTDTAITGVGFQPDFIWFKNRDTTDFHNCYDSVRGVQKVLVPNGTDVEYTDDETLLAFGADGFTIGLRANVNENTEDYVSWNWKAGTTTGIAGSPSITPSSYSFNQTSGFSIIAYTGTGANATVPHGLGVIPGMIIVKTLNTLKDWDVYHTYAHATPEDYILVLNTTAAQADNNTAWNDTAPTSTLFSLGDGGDTNVNTKLYIAYCFANVLGYSKFGSYTGNGAAEGPFVYTGFRPAWIMFKSVGTAPWAIYDDQRVGYNVVNNYLYANTTEAEVTAADIDILSNGFKLRNNGSAHNGSSQAYTYAAFAEAPLVNAEGVPVNAR